MLSNSKHCLDKSWCTLKINSISKPDGIITLIISTLWCSYVFLSFVYNYNVNCVSFLIIIRLHQILNHLCLELSFPVDILILFCLSYTLWQKREWGRHISNIKDILTFFWVSKFYLHIQTLGSKVPIVNIS